MSERVITLNVNHFYLSMSTPFRIKVITVSSLSLPLRKQKVQRLYPVVQVVLLLALLAPRSHFEHQPNHFYPSMSTPLRIKAIIVSSLSYRGLIIPWSRSSTSLRSSLPALALNTNQTTSTSPCSRRSKSAPSPCRPCPYPCESKSTTASSRDPGRPPPCTPRPPLSAAA